MIPTVKPLWIEHSLGKRKVQNPRQYSPDPRYFMSNVVACSADLPVGDTDAIYGGILAMGGNFHPRLTNQTTHLIALSIDSEDCQTVIKRKMDVKIVLPHWIDDCLRVGRKINEAPYTLPDPDILRISSHEKTPYNHRQTHVHGATDVNPLSSPPASPSATRRRQSVFKNQKVLLGKNLEIGDRTREILEDIITSGGGKIVGAVPHCSMFVCKFREGWDYKLAARSGKHVGSLSWLYYLITTDTWTSPFRRLLHYPVDPKGIPGFQDFKISVSNYTGEARTYLENLIIACGGQCTKTLKQDNTHLITAWDKSEKCNAAKEWNVHLVNHLWLEESFAKWTIASTANSRYTHFPRRTNLGEVVGQTELDRAMLEKLFYPPEDDVNDNPTTKGAMKRANSKTIKGTELRTPAASRFVALEKENITPSTMSSRKSKDAAAAKIHELTPDMLLYEKERKRVGGVVYGGNRRTKATDDPAEAGRKRSIDEAAGEDIVAEPEHKKKQKTGLPPPTMHLLVTGYNRWKDAAKVEEADKVSISLLSMIRPLTLPGYLATTRYHPGVRPSEGNPSCSTPNCSNCEVHFRFGLRAHHNLNQFRRCLH